MPRSHKPSEVSQATMQQNNGERLVRGNGHHCPKSPTGSHRWSIESPRGETSTGICRYCGDQREFANTLAATFSVRSK